MSQRHEFVVLATQSPLTLSELCRRYGVSRKTAYKWLARYRAGGSEALADRSRRPLSSPGRVCGLVADQVVALRQADLLDKDRVYGPVRRFERAVPNALWQSDFKGHFATQTGPRCHPLTMLDDHSRFNLVLEACDNERTETVQAAFTAAFERYGLPEAILCDNGNPWGNVADGTGHTQLSVWLLRLGVRVLHGRPRHPQTQGKEERFHRSFGRECLRRHTWRDLAHCAEQFARYRHRYNHERPHDALNQDTPASRYQPSVRAMPRLLPALEYSSAMPVRVVRSKGVITFGNQTWHIGNAFASLPVGLRPSPQADGQWEVHFGHFCLGHLDLRQPHLAKYLIRPLANLTSPQD